MHQKVNVHEQNFVKISLQEHFFATGLCLILHEQLLCLSHSKTRWTMSVDIVCLKICPLCPYGHSDIFSLI